MKAVVANQPIAVGIEDQELVQLLEQVDTSTSKVVVRITDDQGYGICLPGAIHEQAIVFCIPEPLCLLVPEQPYTLKAVLEIGDGQQLPLLEHTVALSGRGQERQETVSTEEDSLDVDEALDKAYRHVQNEQQLAVPEDVLEEIMSVSTASAEPKVTRQQVVPVYQPEELIEMVEQDIEAAKQKQAEARKRALPVVPPVIPLSSTAQTIKVKLKQALKAALG
jgi:hypothetical protein